MGLFSIADIYKRNTLKSYNELDIANKKEDPAKEDDEDNDYSLSDGEEPAKDDSENEPTPQPEDDENTDYSLSDGEENKSTPKPENEEDPEKDDSADYSLSDDGEEPAKEEDSEKDDSADYNLPDDGSENPEDSGEDTSGEDYDLSDDGEANPNPETPGEPENAGEQDPSVDNGDESINKNLKDAENELFSSLSPEQIAIRDVKLKQDYNELYITVDQVILKLNETAKSTETIKVIEFLIAKLSELKEMVNFSITTTINLKTYIENLEIYQTYLSVLNTVNKIIEEIGTNPVE